MKNTNERIIAKHCQVILVMSGFLVSCVTGIATSKNIENAVLQSALELMALASPMLIAFMGIWQCNHVKKQLKTLNDDLSSAKELEKKNSNTCIQGLDEACQKTFPIWRRNLEE